MKPISRRKEAFIVEFKVAKKVKDLAAKAEEAVRQIEDKRYVLELENDGYEIHSMYGIAFCGKDCFIKWKPL